MPKIIYEHSGPDDLPSEDYVDGMAGVIADEPAGSSYDGLAGDWPGVPAIAWPAEFDPERAGSRPAKLDGLAPD